MLLQSGYVCIIHEINLVITVKLLSLDAIMRSNVTTVITLYVYRSSKPRN